MKKVLLSVIALMIIGITSCKKEEGAQPDSSNTVKVLDKKDNSTWD